MHLGMIALKCDLHENTAKAGKASGTFPMRVQALFPAYLAWLCSVPEKQHLVLMRATRSCTVR